MSSAPISDCQPSPALTRRPDTTDGSAPGSSTSAITRTPPAPNVRAAESECALLFRSHPVIDLYYEDLVSDRDRQMQAIQSFLELRHEPVSSALVRQRRRPLSHDIANYDDLKRAFAGTQWAGFFRETAD